MLVAYVGWHPIASQGLRIGSTYSIIALDINCQISLIWFLPCLAASLVRLEALRLAGASEVVSAGEKRSRGHALRFLHCKR